MALIDSADGWWDERTKSGKRRDREGGVHQIEVIGIVCYHVPEGIAQDRLTSLEIANIIMREDNWLIAFTNLGLLTDTLPWYIPVRIVYTRAVLWVIRWLVFGWMSAFTTQDRNVFRVYIVAVNMEAYFGYKCLDVKNTVLSEKYSQPSD